MSELAPGEAREVGESLYDQLRANPTPPPDALLEVSYEFLGDDDIPYAVYTSLTMRRPKMNACVTTLAAIRPTRALVGKNVPAPAGSASRAISNMRTKYQSHAT